MTMAAVSGVGSEESKRSLLAALAARFGTRFSTGLALREQHANTLTWIECQPPDAVVFAETTPEVSCLYHPLFAPRRKPPADAESPAEGVGGSNTATTRVPSASVTARTEPDQRPGAAVLG